MSLKNSVEGVIAHPDPVAFQNLCDWHGGNKRRERADYRATVSRFERRYLRR